MSAAAAAVAFDAEPESADEWVVLSAAAGPSAGPAAPTPKAQALAKAAAAEAAATNSAAELAAAQRELTAVRAELALTRGRLAAAEHESARLTALSAQQRHTITHLSNQLQLVTAAAGAPVPPAAADDSSSAAALAAAAAAGDGHAAPLRAAELRAQRRAAKASKHHTKGACKPAVPLVLSTKQPVRAS